jgi:hypothetical protein
VRVVAAWAGTQMIHFWGAVNRKRRLLLPSSNYRLFAKGGEVRRVLPLFPAAPAGLATRRA